MGKEASLRQYSQGEGGVTDFKGQGVMGIMSTLIATCYISGRIWGVPVIKENPRTVWVRVTNFEGTKRVTRVIKRHKVKHGVILGR